MTRYQLLLVMGLGCRLVWCDGVAVTGASIDTDSTRRAQQAEGAESMVVSLPGQPLKRAVTPPPSPAPPEPPAAPPPSAVAPPAPAAPSKAALPPEFQRQAGAYLERLIGSWTLPQAKRLLGEPVRQRPSFGEDKSPNGRIYAFADPSKRYKELELQFDQTSGTLQSVFLYPTRLTWQDCRRLWGGEASLTEAAKGRKFYSYVSRRLDVLVDADGKVISLGLY